MNRRTFGQVLATATFGSTTFLAAPFARAEPLTPTEREALARGASVRRPVDADLEQGTYQGGVSYAVVKAPAAFVLAMLQEVDVYRSILALTLEAKLQGTRGADRLVYLKHGGKLGTAGYTLRIRNPDSDGVIRFWMDPTFEHEIEDVWGYVRVEPLGPAKCLATYAILCDLGSILRVLFGERIRRYALDTPEHIQSVAESAYAAIPSTHAP